MDDMPTVKETRQRLGALWVGRITAGAHQAPGGQLQLMPGMCPDSRTGAVSYRN